MLRVAFHWKATIHIYSLKKFQKIQKFIAFIVACPKMQKSVVVLLVLWGLNLISYVTLWLCFFIKSFRLM
jgi:hypothetical protein